MKKIVFGIIIGFVLSFSVSAYADDIKSLVGKSVQKEVNVSVNGKKIEGAGIIVNGSTYLPVRKIAESIGYDANVAADKSVELSKKVGGAMGIVDNNQSEKPIVNRTVNSVQSEIEDLEIAIQSTKMGIYSAERDVKKNPDIASFADDLSNLKNLLNQQETKLEELKKEKSELESK